ncbi:3357_t:CDS:1 [Acaulospora colombiana]|uniref:3357_t:CDS:1 n=1 Tax=Acaulospora colombiana TaxID=27376 RepID=A0ACA9NGD7_9GLOM|nr:3357_t:CDS:1 [Acaulospora colombiana]
MTEKYKQVVNRIPKEIWWMILDEAVDQHNPLFFSTTFEGSNWSTYSTRTSIRQEAEQQNRAETQRKIIGSVCRSWQVFARLRRDRRITITWGEMDNMYQLLERASSACRGELYNGVCQWIIFTSHCVKGFNWEIVEMNMENIEIFLLIPFPRLRRLRMRPTEGFDHTRFLDALVKFNNITWLDYQGRCDSSDRSPAVDEKRPPVVVSNLQVLSYGFQGPLEYPFQHLSFPSLRYLSFHIDAWPSYMSLTEVLSHYRRTLQSCVIKVQRVTTLFEWNDQFPPWDEFPKLEELVIDRPWVTNFHPLPSNHPLQRLEAQYKVIDGMKSLLEGAHMKEIILQRVSWASDGGLKGKGQGLIMDKVEVDCFIEQARCRGIVFKVSWNPGRYLPRPKFL